MLHGVCRRWLVLGIESSCDDTGAAVLRGDGTVLGEALASQAGIHEAWGGVVPKLAQEAHAKAIDETVSRTARYPARRGIAHGTLVCRPLGHTCTRLCAGIRASAPRSRGWQVRTALERAAVRPDQLSAIAVTVGPGLALCLEVGVRKAVQVRRSVSHAPLRHTVACGACTVPQ